jgi:hypothetical protein
MVSARAVIGIAILLLGGPTCAASGERVALVIGNSDYGFKPLDNPANDADDVAAALRRLQFDVMQRKELTEAKFDTALDEFENKAKDADVALFFFSGHGVRINKSGYLVPIGFEPSGEGSALRRLIGIQETVERIEKAARVSVFVLDACRDSPLPEQLRRGGKSRGLGAEKGLPLLSELGSNTFVVYATVPGETASDGTGRNSPFTAALLKHLETPGLEIQAMFTRVTADVLQETGRKQQPERVSRLQTELMLLPSFTGTASEAAPLAKANTVASQSISSIVPEATKVRLAPSMPAEKTPGYLSQLQELDSSTLREGLSGVSKYYFYAIAIVLLIILLLGLRYYKRRPGISKLLETFYGVFEDEFHLTRGEAPPPGDLIAPLQNVVFDYKGDYYAAVPLDFREENYEQWARARANAPIFESSRALEHSRYLAAVFAALEAKKLVRLLGEEKKSLFGAGNFNGLDDATVRAKLDKQGSIYAQADAFRIYRFQPGKWAGLLIETVGAAVAKQDAGRRGEVFAGWLKSRQIKAALPKSNREPAAKRLPDRSTYSD